MKKEAAIELNENEVIVQEGSVVFVNGSIPDNPFFDGRETGMDGKMIITNQRIYFRTKKHLILRDLLKEEFSINLSNLDKIEKENLFIFIPFFLVFRLKNGTKLKFSFGFSREKWIKAIQSVI
jgi:hypothetical protein